MTLALSRDGRSSRVRGRHGGGYFVVPAQKRAQRSAQMQRGRSRGRAGRVDRSSGRRGAPRKALEAAVGGRKVLAETGARGRGA
jgi:hypothetical protein